MAATHFSLQTGSDDILSAHAINYMVIGPAFTNTLPALDFSSSFHWIQTYMPIHHNRLNSLSIRSPAVRKYFDRATANISDRIGMQQWPVKFHSANSTHTPLLRTVLNNLIFSSASDSRYTNVYRALSTEDNQMN